MPHQYIIPTITPHPIIGEKTGPDEYALKVMRERTQDWPDTRWAAAQCVDMSSDRLGHMQFVAVGPERAITCIDNPTLIHWSYYFVGWVNLDTGKIQSEVPL